MPYSQLTQARVTSSSYFFFRASFWDSYSLWAFWLLISLRLIPWQSFLRALSIVFRSSSLFWYSCFLTSSILRSFSCYLSSFQMMPRSATRLLPAMLSSFLRPKIYFFNLLIEPCTWLFSSMTSWSFLHFFKPSSSFSYVLQLSMIFLLLDTSPLQTSSRDDWGLLARSRYFCFFFRLMSMISWNFLSTFSSFQCSLSKSFSFMPSYSSIFLISYISTIFWARLPRVCLPAWCCDIDRLISCRARDDLNQEDQFWGRRGRWQLLEESKLWFMNKIMSYERQVIIVAEDMTLEGQTADDFLKIADKFKLGCLLTEQQNPKTIGLSEYAQTDLPKAIDMIKGLDIELVESLKSKLPELERLYKEVNNTVETGGRIFICGCGATGRLSIVLETLWRQETGQWLQEWSEKVIAFMAGGDAALIKSVEDFEDHPEFAWQQLTELGFKENDLMIGSTEGGETSWVIGAVQKSAELSQRKPFILYGNTDQILINNVERSRKFIENPLINKINCNVGYMALAGSTRMQSTTILMYAIGLTLLGCDRLRQLRGQKMSWGEYAEDNVNTYRDYILRTDFSCLAKLIEYETNIYKQGERVSYCTDQYYAVSILTDTTERSPTFSLTPFRSKYCPTDKESWCNLNILHSEVPLNLTWEQRVEKDWREMLGKRQIRGLNSAFWAKYKNKVSKEIILGFGLHEERPNKITISHPLTFKMSKGEELVFKLDFPAYPSNCRLSHHSVLKILLNNLSTVAMGRMGRYSSNIMTFVKPTNYKLIDRSARYVLILRSQTQYQEAVRAIYKIKDKIKMDEPIVLKVIEYLDQNENQA